MNQPAQATIMLFGVFHFNNPGRDLVKTNIIDVTTADSQEYLCSLSQSISKFAPTHVLLEYDQINDNRAKHS